MVEMKLGLPSNIVKLAPYNPAWPEIYAAEEARIREALILVYPFSIAHIGSTAVPGLGAKPVVDIMIGLPDMKLALVAQKLLVEAGYTAKGEKGIPGRLFFTGFEPTTFHIHLVEMNGSFWYEHLLFRDQLRTQQHIAEEYMEVKRRLAARFPNDRDSYTSGKASFIEEVLANAQNA